MPEIFELKGVSKHFSGFSLTDVSFSLPEGFIMGFIGQNGAGKTTTIKLMLNMLSRDGGDIRIFGRDNMQYEQEIKERVGVVLDQPFYVEDWTLRDVEAALSPFYRKWDSATYYRQLWEFALDPKKKVKELSRGMKVKLMIAVALSHQADLLILDEPTSGLDAVARSELMEILSAFIADESKGVLFSTHITSDLEKIADYITFIRDGHVLSSCTKDELLERYRIVRGGLGALGNAQRREVIGYREHGVGFDGLIESEKLRLLPASVIAEKSNLDEIVVRFGMGGNRNE